eukprot:gene2578-2977_t
MYRPPDTSKYLNKDFDALFSDMMLLSTAEDKELTLAGDLHCDCKKSSNNKPLKNIIEGCNLKQMISSPTRVTKNTQTLIDIMACSHPNHIAKTKVYSTSLSDHDLTGLCRNTNCKRFVPRRILTRNYKSYNPQSFKNDNLKAVKAAGIDNVPPGMMKDAAEELRDPSTLDNYRPITVIPVLSKVLEKGRSTQHAVTLLTDKIRQNIDKGYCTDRHMNLQHHFEKVYKKASARVKILSHIQNRAAKIASPREPLDCWDEIARVRNRRIAMDVFKCLNGLSPEQFSEVFRRHQHGKGTRGNNSSVVLPPIKTETGKRMLSFQGAQVFNKLPKDIHEEKSLLRFKHKIGLYHGL